MRADDLKLDELVHFEEGRLSLQGRRLVLHDMRAFAQFRGDLFEMVGLEQTRRILTRFGFIWGEADAAAMKRVFTWDSLEELLKAGPRLHSLEGVARTLLGKLTLDTARRRLRMEVTWHDSGEAEEQLSEFGPSTTPACWVLMGYASGYASYATGWPVYFIEEKCRAQGDHFCRATGMDRESWGERLNPVLPYFQSEDIQGKIQALTEELKRKTRLLQQRDRGAAGIPGEAVDGCVEVRSRAFRNVLELAHRVAPYDSSVLITGESGVGKEVLARYIHANSTRRRGIFLGVNCGALPEALLDSELFGHKAGAFTGAVRDRPGLFERAHKGTLFLDEIGDVSPAMQVKLLRVLQEHEIIRVGDSTPRRVDVRVLAATNRELKAAMASGAFREDLFYRLAVVEIPVPPLRDRPEDVLPLARFLVQRLARRLRTPGLRLDASCLEYLMAYAWPGNVRELENALERAAVFSGNRTIQPEHLPPAILRGARPATGGAPAPGSLQDHERLLIEQALAAENGHRGRTAKRLGISAATLWRKLKSYGHDRG